MSGDILQCRFSPALFQDKPDSQNNLNSASTALERSTHDLTHADADSQHWDKLLRCTMILPHTIQRADVTPTWTVEVRDATSATCLGATPSRAAQAVSHPGDSSLPALRPPASSAESMNREADPTAGILPMALINACACPFFACCRDRG